MFIQHVCALVISHTESGKYSRTIRSLAYSNCCVLPSYERTNNMSGMSFTLTLRFRDIYLILLQCSLENTVEPNVDESTFSWEARIKKKAQMGEAALLTYQWERLRDADGLFS